MLVRRCVIDSAVRISRRQARYGGGRLGAPHWTSSPSSVGLDLLIRSFSTQGNDEESDADRKAAFREMKRKDLKELDDLKDRYDDPEAAVDHILREDGLEDIANHPVKKEPEFPKDSKDISDEQLDAMFKDDLKDEDFVGGEEYTPDTDDPVEDRDADTNKVPDAEPEIPKGEKQEFQAETRQLLDIVTNSLYTDKEVFLRELVSNASDALEKLRHMQVTNQVGATDDVPLEIRIETDEVASTLTITDTGIGMTRDELVSNLGTIARSGSKQFINQLKENEAGGGIDGRGIIGKFGVGFYSAFMVGSKVEVRSLSAKEGSTAQIWSSDGSGTYEVVDLPEGIRQDRGSSLVIHLKDELWEYVSEARIEKILKRYSNFVNFPIFLNGKRVNTLEAIWVNDPKTIKREQYDEFYKYVSNAPDSPLDIYHFRADAPLDVKALFFIPSFHSEKYGMERMEPGVSLYSRKILIEPKSKDIVPDWMRFVKGVVDSEDLPLSISREKPQDTALISKLQSTLARKFVAHINKMAKKEPDRFLNEFYNEYNFFLKEGVCQDKAFQPQLAKLLRYETTRMQTSGEVQNQNLVSLDEYVSRMRPEQNDIYYLSAPSRDAALNSPYLEAFEKAGVEVLLMYSGIDDFVMNNLEKYEDRKLVSAEMSDIDLKKMSKAKKDGDDKNSEAEKAKSPDGLTSAECLEFCDWVKRELGDEKLDTCTVSDRLTTSPAIVTDTESGAVRRMMKMVNANNGEDEPLPPQKMEVNPNHPIIKGIHGLMDREPRLARVVTEQVFDNCLISAGLMDDSRTMIPRINDLLQSVVNTAEHKSSIPASFDDESPEIAASSDYVKPEVDTGMVEDNLDSSSSSSDSDNENVSEAVVNEKPSKEKSKEE